MVEMASSAAISPCWCPPIPSATTNRLREWSVSTRSWFSLRTQPTSVRAKDSSIDECPPQASPLRLRAARAARTSLVCQLPILQPDRPDTSEVCHYLATYGLVDLRVFQIIP